MQASSSEDGGFSPAFRISSHMFPYNDGQVIVADTSSTSGSVIVKDMSEGLFSSRKGISAAVPLPSSNANS